MCRSAGGHGGPGCDDYGEPQARGPGHLRRGARLSTHAGGVGGDECGAGRRVSRWQCAGADGALERGASCLRRSAENGEDLLLSGDSACHESELLKWLRDEKREGGPEGFIGFAISARMSEALHQALVAVPEAEWKPYPKSSGEEIRECAEVPFVPGEKSEPKDSQPLRYVALRIRKRQGELFADGSAVRHFAVLTNLWAWKPERLIAWHREKAGTVEMVHDVLKNELAAGVLPSKYFGANAAWLRLAALAHNVLTALKRLALPPEWLSARPKRL